MNFVIQSALACALYSSRNHLSSGWNEFPEESDDANRAGKAPARPTLWITILLQIQALPVPAIFVLKNELVPFKLKRCLPSLYVQATTFACIMVWLSALG